MPQSGLLTNGQASFEFNGTKIGLTVPGPVLESINGGAQIDPAMDPVALERFGDTTLTDMTTESGAVANRLGHPDTYVKKVTAVAAGVGFVGVPSIAMVPAAAANTAPSVVSTSQIPPTVTLNIKRSSSAKAYDVATKRLIIGEDVRIKTKRKPNAEDCIETKPGQKWTNSVRLANGKIHKYVESVPATLCKDPASRTGWLKRGGGKTGRDCKNPAAPPWVKPPKKGADVLNVRDLDEEFTLEAKAPANAEAICPGSKASSNAFARAIQKFRLRSYLRKTGQGQARTSIELFSRAETTANATASCESTEVTTTTPGTTSPPPPPPVMEKPNNPPNGIMDLHERIEFTTGKVCVTDIKDPDGDIANVVDFRFTGPTGTSIGVERGEIDTLPAEVSTTKTQCQDYEAPSVFSSQGRVTVEAVLSDGKPNGIKILRNNMPIVPEER